MRLQGVLKKFLRYFKVFPEDSKKLQDVQQEREGTSLNYFKVIFNYIKQFSWSIILYLVLSQFISVYLGLSWSISVHLGASRSISV